MPIRAVIFDVGGVLLCDAGEGLEAKWEQQLRLKEGEFIQRLLASGVVGPANAGTIEAEELWRQLVQVQETCCVSGSRSSQSK